MVTNLIFFLYGIKIDYIRQRENEYIFFFNNDFYVFKECFDTEEKLIFLNKFILTNNRFHSLIKNRYSRFLSSFNNSFYILMKVRIRTNRLVVLDDALKNNLILSTIDERTLNWTRLWKEKVDQVELYINKVNLEINNLAIINYFLNLSDLAINYFNEHIRTDLVPLTLCHKRMSVNLDLYGYYSVVDVVFDHYMRDVAEFIKCDIYSDKMLDINKYKSIEGSRDIHLLISRLLFPTYFFDIFDDYVLNNKSFDNFYKHFLNLELFEQNLFLVIDFLQK
jgi:hypothetical protein